MKVFVEYLVSKIANISRHEIRIIDHGSKSALLSNISSRLAGYKKRCHEDIKVLILVDRDRDDCILLKKKLENFALSQSLATKSAPDQFGNFQVVNRIVIEELEAWFFGDNVALTRAFDRIPSSICKRAAYRNPDAIAGGTWEALSRVLKRYNYYLGTGGIPKIEISRKIAKEMSIENNCSKSFNAFVGGLQAILD